MREFLSSLFIKYYMITLMIDGAYSASYLRGSIPLMLCKFKGKPTNIVILNYWRISKKEWMALKNSPNNHD